MEQARQRERCNSNCSYHVEIVLDIVPDSRLEQHHGLLEQIKSILAQHFLSSKKIFPYFAIKLHNYTAKVTDYMTSIL